MAQDLFGEIEAQRGACARIMAGKDALIGELRAELKLKVRRPVALIFGPRALAPRHFFFYQSARASPCSAKNPVQDDDYVKSLKRQAEEVEQLLTHMGTQFRELQAREGESWSGKPRLWGGGMAI